MPEDLFTYESTRFANAARNQKVETCTTVKVDLVKDFWTKDIGLLAVAIAMTVLVEKKHGATLMDISLKDKI